MRPTIFLDLSSVRIAGAQAWQLQCSWEGYQAILLTSSNLLEWTLDKCHLATQLSRTTPGMKSFSTRYSIFGECAVDWIIQVLQPLSESIAISRKWHTRLQASLLESNQYREYRWPCRGKIHRSDQRTVDHWDQRRKSLLVKDAFCVKLRASICLSC